MLQDRHSRSNGRVGVLSGGERQSIAIRRAVYFGKLLILDDRIGVSVVKPVRCWITPLKDGASVIFISHIGHGIRY
jgi:ABC-type sugar transport system ATPase subunit